MRKFIKDETGEFAIDAIFGITFFMISLIVIMFMALIIRVQSNIQYALGQTAKEISGYYYLVDKIGLAAATSGSNETTDVDKTIQTIVDFSGNAQNTAGTVQEFVINATDLENINSIDFGDYESNLEENLNKVESSVKESYESFKKIESSIENLDGDSVTQVLSVFAQTAANRAVSNFIAPIICKKLMPKYLSAQKYNTIDEYYEAIGISNVSFKESQFLTDKRSIKVQITYQLDLEKYTLGFVKSPMYFKQVASTAAWVRPDGKNLVALSDLK
ncbi:MAG: hypothetical protein HDT22_05440 [Ruminococcus sp.]|nr:hypothetical protein [Ruminococcus sp.]